MNELLNRTFITTDDVRTLERHFLAPCTEWDNGWNVFVIPKTIFNVGVAALRLRFASASAFVAVRCLSIYYHEAVALGAARYNVSYEELEDYIDFEIAMEKKAFACTSI